jgi:hypothetical protein
MTRRSSMKLSKSSQASSSSVIVGIRIGEALIVRRLALGDQ